MNSLQGRTAVVTGASQGIGLAVARAYLDEGANVAIVDMQEPVDDSLDADIADGRAHCFNCDVSDRNSVERTYADIVDRLGAPNVLVNNAGITRPAMIWKMTDKEWDDVIAVHLTGSWYWMQAVIPAMREEGWGRIISSISSAGLNGTIGQANYAAAKAGLLALTRSAARELGRYGILANAVAPAASTPMTATIREDDRFADRYLERKVIQRWADPFEVAPTYVFLAGEGSSYMTGQILSVDGGGTFVR